MSCTFEDAFMGNPLDESMDDANDSEVRPQEFSTEEPTEEIMVNNARVMMLKAEIAAGTFQIKSETIAEKLVEELVL